MSRFYASIQGGRGEATRQGHTSSGIHGHIRGWNLGVNVDGYTVGDGRADAFSIRITGGSHGRFTPVFIGEVMEWTDGRMHLAFGEALADRIGAPAVILEPMAGGRWTWTFGEGVPA